MKFLNVYRQDAKGAKNGSTIGKQKQTDNRNIIVSLKDEKVHVSAFHVFTNLMFFCLTWRPWRLGGEMGFVGRIK